MNSNFWWGLCMLHSPPIQYSGIYWMHHAFILKLTAINPGSTVQYKSKWMLLCSLSFFVLSLSFFTSWEIGFTVRFYRIMSQNHQTICTNEFRNQKTYRVKLHTNTHHRVTAGCCIHCKGAMPDIRRYSRQYLHATFRDRNDIQRPLSEIGLRGLSTATWVSFHCSAAASALVTIGLIFLTVTPAFTCTFDTSWLPDTRCGG